VRRSAVLVALAGAVAWFLRASRAGRADRDVWTAAVAPPDLR
jgi:hypothetical protein